MLSRSLPEQVRRHLERITRARVALSAAVIRPLRDPLQHERVSQVFGTMLDGLQRIHPLFSFRHVYEPASVNPEIIAYWLVELAQQTRENFCGYAADIPPPEHYGQCASHGRQIAALAEAFIAGVAGDPCRSDPLGIYRERMNGLLGDFSRSQREEINRFVRRIQFADDEREAVRRAIAENLSGKVFFVIPGRNAGPH